MTIITIQCPACKVRLKLRQEPTAGKSLRCPKCESRIVYRAGSDQKATETSGPADSEARRSEKSPKASVLKPETLKSGLPVPASDQDHADTESLNISTKAASDSSTSNVETFPDLTPSAGILNQVRSRRSRRKASPRRLLISTVIILISTLSIVVAFRFRPKATAVSVGISEQPTRLNAPAGNSREAGSEMMSRSAQENSGQKSHPEKGLFESSPTSGSPIPVSEIPFSADLICHLHPSEIWKDTPELREFRQCLPELEPWMKSLVQKYASSGPESVSELTFAMNFGPRGSKPDVAAVIRLAETVTPDVLQQRFGSRLIQNSEQQPRSSEEISVRQIDPRTFMVGAPDILLDQFSDGGGGSGEATLPGTLSASMEQQIAETDRDRQLTIVFNPKMIEVHRDFLLPEQTSVKLALDRILQELTPDVELATLSVHLSPHCHLDTQLLPSNSTSLAKLEASVRSGLRRYPEQMLTSLRATNPRTRGEQILAGRAPAMIKAIELGSEVSRTKTHVRIISLLPQNAAASLAASMRSAIRVLSPAKGTSPTASGSVVDSSGMDVRQQIQKPILVDFRNQPLQEVIAFIAQETGVSISIDGDALKSAGFTQNMPQTLSAERQPAGKALNEILSKYAKERDPIVVCMDATAKSLLVTTRSAAAAKKLSELNLSAP
ncbi:MAG: hypothetical protein ACK526_20160 [Planctomyces sp.]